MVNKDTIIMANELRIIASHWKVITDMFKLIEKTITQFKRDAKSIVRSKQSELFTRHASEIRGYANVITSHYREIKKSKQIITNLKFAEKERLEYELAAEISNTHAFESNFKSTKAQLKELGFQGLHR